MKRLYGGGTGFGVDDDYDDENLGPWEPFVDEEVSPCDPALARSLADQALSRDCTEHHRRFRSNG